MLNKTDDLTYVIEKSTTLKEDIVIEEGEKLLICGKNTKVTAGGKMRITIINKGTIENQGNLYLSNCDLINESNDFHNRGIISIQNNSVLYQGREKDGAIRSNGVIDIKDQGRFVNGEFCMGTCINVGTVSISKTGVFQNGAAGKGVVLNQGTFLMGGNTSLVRSRNSSFENYGNISGRITL